jgi:hypothetical protein
LNKHIQSKNAQFFSKLFNNTIRPLEVPKEKPFPTQSSPAVQTGPAVAPSAPPASGLKSSQKAPLPTPLPSLPAAAPVAAPLAPPALATVSVAPCSIRGAGLDNLGNTCFFNSTIKALWTTRTFLPMLKERNERLNEFLAELIRPGSNINAGKKYEMASFLNQEDQFELRKFCRSKKGSSDFEMRVIEKMKILFQKEKAVTSSAISLFDEIGKATPVDIKGKLTSLIDILKRTDIAFDKLFPANHEQQDAYDFYAPFLATLVPDFGVASNSSLVIQRPHSYTAPEDVPEIQSTRVAVLGLRAALEDGRIETATPEVNEPEVVRQRGSPDQVVIPEVVGAKKTDLNSILVLSLDKVAPGKAISLQDWFTGYQYEETIEKARLLDYIPNRNLDEATINEFTETLPGVRKINEDSVCVSAVRSQLLRDPNPPHLLPLEIKRFKQDDYGRRLKNSQKVQVPFSMQVSHIGESGISQNKTYRLCSAVVHSGGAGGGHYYTYIPVYDSESAVTSTTIREHSDTSISEVTPQRMKADIEEKGYLFFYELVEEVSPPVVLPT